MGFQFSAPEEVGGSSDNLKTPGVYHMIIDAIHDGVNHKGTVVDGFHVDLVVLSGEEKDKVYHYTLFNPNLSKSEASQEWNRKKQAAMLIASNAMRPDQLGTSVDINLDGMAKHQIIIDLQEDDREGENGLQVNYANIYHVDDPRAKKYAKDAASLAVIPANFRHDKDADSYFAKLLNKKAPTTGGSSAASKPLSNDELDGL